MLRTLTSFLLPFPPSTFYASVNPEALGACLREFLFSEVRIVALGLRATPLTSLPVRRFAFVGERPVLNFGHFLSRAICDMQAFVGLGLPAARAVSVCSTGEGAKIRDSDPRNSGVLKRARGAVLCRVAPSFLRFGTFELPARRGDVELVGKLADYCLRHLVPHLESSPSIGPIQTEDSRRRQYGDPIFPGKDPSMEGNEKEDEHINRGMGHGAGDHLGMLVAMVQVSPRFLSDAQLPRGLHRLFTSSPRG